MNLTKSIENVVNDSLKSFKALQIIIACICILIPVIFRLSDKDFHYPQPFNEVKSKFLKSNNNQEIIVTSDLKQKTGLIGFTEQYCGEVKPDNTFKIICKDKFGFRSSLSDYAHSSNSYLFGLMYTIAAMMYVYNGVIYLKQNKTLLIQKKEALVHLLIGLCLIGVILHPLDPNDNGLHVIFSILFFLGNVCLMLFFKKDNESSKIKRIRILMGILAILSFIGIPQILNYYSIMWAESFSLFIIAIYLIMISYSTNWRYQQAPR